MRQQTEQWRQQQLSNDIAKLIIYRAFMPPRYSLVGSFWRNSRIALSCGTNNGLHKR
jgi:hypothetical protein